MFSEIYHKIAPCSNLSINLSVAKTSINNPMNFEIFTMLFSFVGPLLSSLFIVFIIPISTEYHSYTSWTEIHQFTKDYQSILINLMYLLGSSAIFAFIGLMFGIIHKKVSLIVLNFLSIIIVCVMFLPMMIMIIGD